LIAKAATPALRDAKTLLYFDRCTDFDQICRALAAEWQPATPTEAALVEQLARDQAKLERLETNLSHAFYQSVLMQTHLATDTLIAPDGTAMLPDTIRRREVGIQALITDISKHITRVQRSWHKSLATLRDLQACRRKQKLAPADETADSALIASRTALRPSAVQPTVAEPPAAATPEPPQPPRLRKCGQHGRKRIMRRLPAPQQSRPRFAYSGRGHPRSRSRESP
jgi:hypothetical protein